MVKDEKNFGFGQREQHYFEKHIGDSIDFFTSNGAISGDLVSYDSQKGEIVLENYIKLQYNKDGTSKYIEDHTQTLVKESIIIRAGISSKEERLGRILNYNKNLLKENENQNLVKK